MHVRLLMQQHWCIVCTQSHHRDKRYMYCVTHHHFDERYDARTFHHSVKSYVHILHVDNTHDTIGEEVCGTWTSKHAISADEHNVKRIISSNFSIQILINGQGTCNHSDDK